MDPTHRMSYLLNKKYKFLYFALISIFVFDAFRGGSNKFNGLSSIFSLNSIILEKIEVFNNFYSNALAPLVKLFLFLIPIFAVIAVEMIIVSKDKKLKIQDTSIGKLRSSEDADYADLFYFSIHLLTYIFPVIITILSLGFQTADSSLQETIRNFYKSIIPLPNGEFNLLVLLIITILLTDFANYIKHVIDHKTFLWELHEFHHSAPEMNIFANYRDTYLSALSGVLFLLPLYSFTSLLLLESLSEGGYFIFFVYSFWIFLSKMFNVLGHSSLKIIYPKPFSYVFMSPSLHWIHHSKNPNHYDKNFGFIFCLWDRIFGTYLDETNIEDIPGYGVSKSRYNMHHPLYSYFVMPYKKLFKKILYIANPQN